MVKVYLVAKNFKEARKIFTEPFKTSLSFLLKSEGFQALYRDGRLFRSDNIFEFYGIRHNEYAEFNWNGLTLRHAERGACEEVFAGVYSQLSVMGKFVLDIGANIADSAIFFASKGAEHVYALEVNPTLYNIAEENIKINKLENKISLFNWGLGTGSVKIDTETWANGSFQPSDEDHGVSIPLYSLEEVLNKLSGSSGEIKWVLKIDCEGCEYCAILEADPLILKKFEEIIGEYHRDYPLLKEKLEMCGFETKFGKPTYFPGLFKNEGGGLVGPFLARNREI